MPFKKKEIIIFFLMLRLRAWLLFIQNILENFMEQIIELSMPGKPNRAVPEGFIVS
jgi:hypothetical protein